MVEVKLAGLLVAAAHLVVDVVFVVVVSVVTVSLGPVAGAAPS